MLPTSRACALLGPEGIQEKVAYQNAEALLQ
jgi:hypothetical protein